MEAKNISVSEAKNIMLSQLAEIFEKREILFLSDMLLGYLMDLTKPQIHAEPNQILSQKEEKGFLQALDRLMKEEPIEYILGKTTFFDLEFKVNEHVLIPRPETEELAAWIIDEYQNQKPSILDIGTGSGCIIAVLMKNIIHSKGYATDVSEKALETAKSNAERHQLKILFQHHDILKGRPPFTGEKFDVIVSNPPYVREKEKQEMQKNVLAYEPHQALFVPNLNALRYYRKIGEHGLKMLNPGGSLFLEINEYLPDETRYLLLDLGYKNAEVRKDLNDKSRMIKATI